MKHVAAQSLKSTEFFQNVFFIPGAFPFEKCQKNVDISTHLSDLGLVAL